LQNLTNYVAKSIFDAKGDLLAASANDTPVRVGIGSNGQILSANTSTASGLQWVNPSSTLIVQNTMPASPVQGDIWFDTTTGRIYVYYDSFFIEVGTASDFAANLVDAKGDLLVGTANDTLTRLPVGTDEQVLIADSAEASGVRWADPASGFEKVFMMMGA